MAAPRRIFLTHLYYFLYFSINRAIRFNASLMVSMEAA